jgi:signal peptidase I
MKDFLKELLETVALALLIFLALQATVQNYRVELSSMETTLFPKDRLVVNKLVYLHIDAERINRILPFIDIKWDKQILFPFHSPQRGEVIVFHYPKDRSRDFVKRVIALPGESLSITKGQVFIEGESLDEPYLDELDNDSYPPTLIPPDEYFVMGDNRNGSSDSRHWGPVPLADIVGKVWFRYWPPSDFTFMSGGSHIISEDSGVENPS